MSPNPPAPFSPQHLPLIKVWEQRKQKAANDAKLKELEIFLKLSAEHNKEKKLGSGR